ncbi:MAG: hypothetical protein HQM16_02935 [Deltaproteobacteria bacterium]|nr:hypothetical protein [Deltaproteobacteria bacterium]
MTPQTALASLAAKAGDAVPSRISGYTLNHQLSTLSQPEAGFCRGLHVLKPRSQRYLSGLLALTESSGPVLGLARYISAGHAGAALRIQAKFGAIRAFLWGGELLLENPDDTEQTGRLTAINPTSGFLHRGNPPFGDHSAVFGAAVVDNKTGHLLKRTDLPFPVLTGGPAIFAFNRDAPHLFPDMNMFGAQNFRHDYETVMRGTNGYVTLTQEDPSMKEDLGLGSLYKKAQTMQAFCMLLLSLNVVDENLLIELNDLLTMVLSKQTLDEGQYERFTTLMTELLESLIETMSPDSGNEYDLFRF